MIMRSEKVPESPSSALQTTYFCFASTSEHGLPLDAGGKARAAASAQTRGGHLLDDLRAGHRERALESAIAAVREVVVERDRIGNADAREGQPLLILEIRNLVGRTEAQPMLSAGEEIRRRTAMRHPSAATGP